MGENWVAGPKRENENNNPKVFRIYNKWNLGQIVVNCCTRMLSYAFWCFSHVSRNFKHVWYNIHSSWKIVLRRESFYNIHSAIVFVMNLLFL